MKPIFITAWVAKKQEPIQIKLEPKYHHNCRAERIAVSVWDPYGGRTVNINIAARMCGDYIRRVLDWQLDLLDHTQLHTFTVCTLYIFSVHYSACRVFLLCLPKIPAPTAATNSYGITHYLITTCWSCPVTAWLPADVRAIQPVNRPQRKHFHETDR
jgi:hypothetical protein